MSGMPIKNKRSGSSVHIILNCPGDYHAIEVYDRLMEGVKRGKVTIDLKTTSPGRVPPDRADPTPALPAV